MLPSPQSLSRRFHPDELDTLPSDERVEGADGVRARAHAGDDRVRVTAEALSGLQLYLLAYDRLEVAHDTGIRGGPYHAPEDVVRVLDVRDPVPDRLVHCVLERHRTARNGA